MRRLARSRRAAMSVAGAFVALAMTGIAALAVDVGSLHLAQRRLQGVADRAALAAAGSAGGPRVAAGRVVALEGLRDVTIVRADAGGYTPDARIAADARFAAGGGGVPAAQVVLRQQAPLFFARVVTGRDTAAIEVRATAARQAAAAFSIGSRVVRVNGGVPGALLSALAGSELDIGVADYRALLAAKVDLLGLVRALGGGGGVAVGGFDALIARGATLPQFLEAAAANTPDGAAAGVLRRAARRVPHTRLDVARLLDLGPLGAGDRIGTLPELGVGADAVLREALVVAGGERQLNVDLGVGVPGLAGVRLVAVVGDRPRTSPWIRVARDGGVEVTTSQLRALVEVKVDGLGLGIVSITLPILLEGAPARARLASVTCERGGGAAVELDATVAPARLAIGQVSDAELRDLGRPLAPRRVRLVNLLLLGVTARADTLVASSAWQRVRFSPQDIARGEVRTVNAQGLTSGAAATLIGNLDLRVTGIGAILSGGPVVELLRVTLLVLTPAIDALLETVQTVLGVRLGQADVAVHAARCGRPVLVA